VKRHPRTILVCSAPLAALLVASTSAAAADPDHGKLVFQGCAACHHEGVNPLGPSLKGVYGRKSAALEDYRYSPAMMRANLVWDEANLKSFIADPQGRVKGNRMPFGGVTAAADLDDVIAFLKAYK